MGGVPDVGDTECLCCHSADADNATARRQHLDEAAARLDLRPGRRTVRRRRARMRGDDVPEQDGALETEVVQRALHDRRRGLRQSRPRQLALRRERKARNAGAAVAGRLADEQQRRACPVREIGAEAVAQEARPRALRVLVERRPEMGAGKLGHERVHTTSVPRYDAGSESGSSGQPG